ncbi:hypothetical protein [Demequina sp.]|uniref:hypothetical protein n=1 Tax=Demequina sp. TaxID=2050685 RepID=UPI003D13FC59
MRWHRLFDDLEAQVTRAEREEFEDEVRERAHGERAAVTLGAVLAASEGARARVTLRDGAVLAGTVVDCAAQWLHLGDGPREWLVPASAISTIEGPAPAAPEPGVIASRLTLGHALRALAEDGGDVVVNASGTQARGRITAVGADYLVLGDAHVIPYGAVLSVAPAP